MKKNTLHIVLLSFCLIISSLGTIIPNDNTASFIINFVTALFAAFVLGKVLVLRKLVIMEQEFEKFEQNLLTQCDVTQNLCVNERSCRKQCSKRCGDI